MIIDSHMLGVILPQHHALLFASDTLSIILVASFMSLLIVSPASFISPKCSAIL